jgi:eukaryotic-like serine/threonine-protein kinase
MSEQDKENIIFEKFQIIECLKKDDAGAVFRAKHLYLDKDIILKTLNKNVITDNTLISRFLREARILAGIDHPNIIKVLDFGKYKESLYISFSYFDSQNLRQIVKENKTNEEEKLYILEQLISGLAAVHEAGIIHRDLKPENILIGPDLDIKIADFGLALAPNENVVTQKSSIVGTPGYMSPEQVRGEKLTAATDLFALGIIILELYDKKNPFIAEDLNSTLNKILNFQVEQIHSLVSDTPEIIQLIINKTLQNQQSRRAESAGELLRIIQPDSNQQKNRKINRRQLAVIISSIIAILIIVILWWVYPKRDNKIISVQPVQDSISIAFNTAQSHQDLESKPVQISPTNTVRAEIQSTTKPGIQNISNRTGILSVHIQPAARVSINSGIHSPSLVDTTLKMAAGSHILTFSHPSYPLLKDTVNIETDEISTLRINLDSLCAYVHCEVYPWGEIFINERYQAQTPFFQFLKISPGKNILKVKNPDFREYADTIYISRGDTLNLKINLEEAIGSKQ